MKSGTNLKTKILLVDDRRESLNALENIVSSPDIEVLTAQSASDALALLLEHEFALAMLDVRMPEISGFELARLMRSVERSRSIPVIFVTASERERRHIFEGYEKGAVDYLLKPLDAHIVRSKVRVFVELDQKTRALEQKVLEVEALRDEAESASQAKSRFLANISHEIRTPLGAVLGYVQLMKQPDQPKDDRDDCINALERNGELLLHLVNDVLDLSKIEAEKVEIERAATPLADLIADLRAVHSHNASEKGVELTLKASGLLPRTIVTDSMRLKQILHNVVGNAVKFTEKGEVSVVVAYDRQRPGATLSFTIKDSGCGLSEEEATRIFRPFMQADGSTTRRFGGTGLGLTISKQLAGLLGGDVVLTESQQNSGSTFVVTIEPGVVPDSELVDGQLLLERYPAKKFALADLPNRLDGVRVLVADDAKDNRHLLTRFLTFAGALVETADNGSEAIEKALSRPYDIVLMDIQMPITDGYEATSRLRREGFKTPIIALTAHAMKEELGRCLAVGCDHHLSKPINPRLLISSIAEYVARDKAKVH